MKKVLCVILTLFLCIIPVSLAENTDEIIPYEANIANSADRTASEWFSTSMNRALLTILLLYDLPSDSSLVGGNILAGTTYLGKAGSTCILLGRDNDKMVSIYYVPLLKEASYSIHDLTYASDSALDITAERVFSENCDNYYKNDDEDILRCVQLLIDKMTQ